MANRDHSAVVGIRGHDNGAWPPRQVGADNGVAARYELPETGRRRPWERVWSMRR